MSKCNCKNPEKLRDKPEECTRSQNKECCGNTKDHSYENKERNSQKNFE